MNRLPVWLIRHMLRLCYVIIVKGLFEGRGHVPLLHK